MAQRIGALTVENQRYMALRGLAQTEFAAPVKAVRDANTQLAGAVDPLISEKLAVLQAADAFAGQLED